MKNYEGIKKLKPYLFEYKFSIMIFLIFSLSLGFISTLPTLFIGYIIDMIVSPNELSGIAKYIYTALTNNIILMFIIVGILLILLAILNNIFGCIVSNFGVKIKNKIKKDMIKKIVNNYNPFNEELKDGELLNRLTKDIESINQVIVTPINGLVRDVINLLWTIIIFVIWNWKVALLALIFIFPIYFLSKLISKHTKKFAGNIEKIKDDTSNYILSIIKNIKLINVLGCNDKEVEITDDYIDNTTFETKKINKTLAILFPIISIVQAIGLISTLVLTYIYIEKDLITIGSITIAYLYTQRLYGPVLGLSRYAKMFAVADKSLSRVFEIEKFNYKFSVNSNYNIETPPEILFNNLSFRYGDKIIFDNYNMKLQKCKINIIKAESGKGKTTLINLLIGLIKPNSGKILFDNKECQQYRISNASILFQDIMLFDRGLYENIIYGNDDYSIEKMNYLIDILSLRNLVKENGLNYCIDIRNQNLSGGEKRRICLLRTLLKKSALYILDEPTSELDSETSKKIINYLEKLKENATVIICTHDPLVVNIGDNIVEI